MDFIESRTQIGVKVKVRENITGNPNPGYVICSVVYATKVDIIGYWGRYVGWINLPKEYVVKITFELNGEIIDVNPDFQFCSVDQDEYLCVEAHFKYSSCPEDTIENEYAEDKPYGVIARFIEDDHYQSYEMNEPLDHYERKYYLSSERCVK